MQIVWIILMGLLLPFSIPAQDYEVIRTLKGHQGGVQNIRFSPNGKLMASCGKTDYKVIIWNVKTGQRLRTFQGHQDIVYEVSFNATSSMVASASKDGTVQVWDVQSGKLVGRFINQPFISPSKITYHSVVFVCFSADNQYVYFGGDNGYLSKGKLGKSSVGAYYQSKRIVQTNTQINRQIYSITGGSLAPDGKKIMVSIDRFVRVVDPKTQKLVKLFYYPYDYINDVIAGPGKNRITTWSYDGKVSIWDYEQERIINRFQVAPSKNYSVASFNAAGNLLVTGAYGNRARVWNWQSEQAIATLSAHQDIVRIARFSPTKHLIATASYDGKIKLWKPVEPITEEEEKEEIIEEPEPATAHQQQHDDPPNAPIHVNTSKKEIATFYGEALQENQLIELQNVQFEQGKYELNTTAMKELQQIALLMLKHTSIIIEIQGHTDNLGHAMINHRLSDNRAQTSKNYLISLGVPQTRIRTKAFGEQKPIIKKGDESKRKLNRRIEIKIIQL